MTRCPWWVRWYHRRLRQIDRVMVWTSIVATVATRGSERGRAEIMQAAWDTFVVAEGQEHWQCPCAEGADQHGEPQ